MFPTVLWARLVVNGICNGDRSIEGLSCSYGNVFVDILSEFGVVVAARMAPPSRSTTHILNPSLQLFCSLLALHQLYE